MSEGVRREGARGEGAKRRGVLVLAAVTLAGTVAVVLWVSGPTGRAEVTGTEVVRRPGELQAIQDRSQYAPGSPSAVAEAFLRLWWRGHYDSARALSAGGIRARCERNLQKTLTLTSGEREQMRQVQVLAEAAHYDLERAVVTDVEPGDAGLPRKRVEGVIHAYGPSPDGRQVDSRRGQTLELELSEGAWRVVEWQPARTDAGISVH